MDKENSFINEGNFGPIKANAFGEKYLYGINRGSFEKVSAYALFDSKFSESLFAPDSLNIIVGTDSGLLPQYLQQKDLPKGSRYIFIEPSAVLAQLKSNKLLEELDPRIACISLDSWKETIQDFKIQDYFYINAVKSVNAICAQEDNIHEYAELSWHIAEVLTALHFGAYVALGSDAFVACQIANLADNILPAKLLENTFQGKTAVLLAGGPSLVEMLPWVQKYRSQLIVFSVSRISRQLLNASIEPDFICSVDPQDISFLVSKEMLAFGDRTVFIHSYHASPLLVSQWHGVSLYLGSRVPWKSTLNQENLNSHGPTVTNTTLSVAHSFGFKRIILAGVDFCFTKEGYTHAKGSDEYTAGPRFNLTTLQVETNGGYMAPTGSDYASARDSWAAQAKAITATGCQIINPFSSAAKVDHVDFIPLADIKLENDVTDITAIVKEKIADSESCDRYRKKVIDGLVRAQFQIKTIERLAKQALHINEHMYNSQGQIEDYKDKRDLDQIEKELKRNYSYSKLVKTYGIRSFIKMTKPFDDEEWTAEETKELGNIYYQAYSDGAAKLLVLIDSALERARLRLAESSDAPDFERLFYQWRKDRSYARAQLWQQQHPDASIPAGVVAKKFNEFASKFNSVLNEKNTRLEAIFKEHSSLTQLKHRASLLFKHKKTEQLNDLLLGLSKHDFKDEAIPYHYLIKGYLAELENNVEAAVIAYHQVIDCESSPLLEESLTRIAAVSIDVDDIDNAGLALQCLSQITPLYLPFYAEILRLNGDTLAAIDAYNEYISQFPEETITQLKLVSLYIENKTYSAAEIMLDHILTKNPSMETAINIKNQLTRVAESQS